MDSLTACGGIQRSGFQTLPSHEASHTKDEGETTKPSTGHFLWFAQNGQWQDDESSGGPVDDVTNTYLPTVTVPRYVPGILLWFLFRDDEEGCQLSRKQFI